MEIHKAEQAGAGTAHTMNKILKEKEAVNAMRTVKSGTLCLSWLHQRLLLVRGGGGVTGRCGSGHGYFRDDVLILSARASFGAIQQFCVSNLVTEIK